MELSTYPASDLLLKWQREELIVEQMIGNGAEHIGHLLQHLLTLLQRLTELETQVRQIEQRCANSNSHAQRHANLSRTTT